MSISERAINTLLKFGFIFLTVIVITIAEKSAPDGREKDSIPVTNTEDNLQKNENSEAEILTQM